LLPVVLRCLLYNWYTVGKIYFPDPYYHINNAQNRGGTAEAAEKVT